MAELFKGTFRRKIIKPTVPNVGVIEPARREPSQGKGSPHAGTFLVAPGQSGKVTVDGKIQLRQDVLEVRGAAVGPLTKAFREQSGDFIHRDAAGEFPTFGPTHAITHGENIIRLPEGCGAYLAEKPDVPGVEGQS